MTPEELLLKHNPVLVLLPNDVTRHRPWSRWYKRVSRPRGDYHPCTAEFFLSFVKQSRHKKVWNPFSLTEQSLPEPTGLEALRALTGAARPGETADWELDVASIKSRDPDQAWAAYGTMLTTAADLSAPVVYGRYIGGDHPVLEYWYLYVYNDAPNKHEGDWEMVAVELDEDEAPARAGYSGHAGGFVRPWAAVEKDEAQPDRPVVYVARGSHAAYFDHSPRGHRANSLPSRKGLPGPLDEAWTAATKAFQDAATFLRLQDRTAPKASPRFAAAADACEPVRPRLIVMPEREQAGDMPDFWWMQLDCAWGSSHLRFFGSSGPPPPWQQVVKWASPVAWIDGLTPGA